LPKASMPDEPPYAKPSTWPPWWPRDGIQPSQPSLNAWQANPARSASLPACVSSSSRSTPWSGMVRNGSIKKPENKTVAPLRASRSGRDDGKWPYTIALLSRADPPQRDRGYFRNGRRTIVRSLFCSIVEQKSLAGRRRRAGLDHAAAVARHLLAGEHRLEQRQCVGERSQQAAIVRGARIGLPDDVAAGRAQGLHRRELAPRHQHLVGLARAEQDRHRQLH